MVSSTVAAVFIWRTWAIWGKQRVRPRLAFIPIQDTNCGLQWVLYVMGTFLIPTTFFSYVPGLIQMPVVRNGGCIAVSRGTGPLSAKWTFALVNLVCPPSFLSLPVNVAENPCASDIRYIGMCTGYNEAGHESKERSECRIERFVG